MADKPTNFIMLSDFQYQAMLEKLTRIEALLLGGAKKEVESEWIDSEQARGMLGISSQTWQSWRKKRVIPFVQFGRKIYCKRADIEAFMMSNLVKREDC